MKPGLRTWVRVAVVILSISCLLGAPQRSADSLSEDDLVKLIKNGASSNALVELVQKYGISFQPDEPTLDRLRKQGAPDALIDSIRRLRPPSPPKAPESPPREDTSKILEAARHLKLGQLKAQDKDFEGALEEFAQAEKVRPQWDEVYYQRGLVLAGLHRYAEAAAQWKQYLNAAGAEADLKTVQDKIVEWEYQAQKIERAQHLLEQAKERLQDFDADAAIGPLQEVVKTEPSLDNFLLLAQAYWIKRDFEPLSKVAAQALAMDASSAQAILYQGAAELGQEKTDTAVATIQRAITLDPKSGFGYELLCDAWRMKRDLKSAWTQCDTALRINPNSGFAHNRVGWILWSWRNFSGALQELRKATQAEPKNADWQADLAYGLIYQGDVQGASSAAREALRLNPKSPFAHDAMGMVLDAQGDPEKATLEFNEAIRLAPRGHPEFLDHLSKAMRKKKTGG
jgi:tetratricopeptide (TPR) repeat protein